MSYMKEALDLEDDLAPSPMRPIQHEYLTSPRDIEIQTTVLDRQHVVYGFVGRTLYSLSDADSITLNIDAVAQLHAEGIREPTELQAHRKVQQLLTALVVDSASGRSVVKDPEFIKRLTDAWRLQADEELREHGIEIRADIMRKVVASDAA